MTILYDKSYRLKLSDLYITQKFRKSLHYILLHWVACFHTSMIVHCLGKNDRSIPGRLQDKMVEHHDAEVVLYRNWNNKKFGIL